mgnify:CR=1 FL=1
MHFHKPVTPSKKIYCRRHEQNNGLNCQSKCGNSIKKTIDKKAGPWSAKIHKKTCWLTSGNPRQHRPVKEPASLDLHAVRLYATMCPHSRAKRSTKKSEHGCGYDKDNDRACLKFHYTKKGLNTDKLLNSDNIYHRCHRRPHAPSSDSSGTQDGQQL